MSSVPLFPAVAHLPDPTIYDARRRDQNRKMFQMERCRSHILVVCMIYIDTVGSLDTFPRLSGQNTHVLRNGSQEISISAQVANQ